MLRNKIKSRDNRSPFKAHNKNTHSVVVALRRYTSTPQMSMVGQRRANGRQIHLQWIPAVRSFKKMVGPAFF